MWRTIIGIATAVIVATNPVLAQEDRSTTDRKGWVRNLQACLQDASVPTKDPKPGCKLTGDYRLQCLEQYRTIGVDCLKQVNEPSAPKGGIPWE